MAPLTDFMVPNCDKKQQKNKLRIKCGFSKVLGGPGGFKKVREAGRIHLHLSSSRSDFMVPSYDQKTKKLTIKKVATVSM